jgi:hypothetical protein
MALIVEDPHAGGAAQDVGDIHAAGSGHEIVDRGAGALIRALGDDDLGVNELEVRKRQAQDLPSGRILAREQVESLIRDFGRDDGVLEVGDLGPASGRVHQIVGELAAVAIGDRCDQPPPVVARSQAGFGDPRKISANDVAVPLGIRAQLVKIDLLVEVRVLRRALVALWIAGVIEAGAVGLPIEAAASGGEVDSRHNVREFLACGYLENMGRAVL